MLFTRPMWVLMSRWLCCGSFLQLWLVLWWFLFGFGSCSRALLGVGISCGPPSLVSFLLGSGPLCIVLGTFRPSFYEGAGLAKGLSHLDLVMGLQFPLELGLHGASISRWLPLPLGCHCRASISAKAWLFVLIFISTRSLVPDNAFIKGRLALKSTSLKVM